MASNLTKKSTHIYHLFGCHPRSTRAVARARLESDGYLDGLARRHLYADKFSCDAVNARQLTGIRTIAADD